MCAKDAIEPAAMNVDLPALMHSYADLFACKTWVPPVVCSTHTAASTDKYLFLSVLERDDDLFGCEVLGKEMAAA